MEITSFKNIQQSLKLWEHSPPFVQLQWPTLFSHQVTSWHLQQLEPCQMLLGEICIYFSCFDDKSCPCFVTRVLFETFLHTDGKDCVDGWTTGRVMAPLKRTLTVAVLSRKHHSTSQKEENQEEQTCKIKGRVKKNLLCELSRCKWELDAFCCNAWFLNAQRIKWLG